MDSAQSGGLGTGANAHQPASDSGVARGHREGATATRSDSPLGPRCAVCLGRLCRYPRAAPDDGEHESAGESLRPLVEPEQADFPHSALGERSRGRPRKAGSSCRKPNQSKLVVQELVGVPLGTYSLPFMFGAQPLATPSASMLLYCPIGLTDRSQAKVVAPTNHHPIEGHDYHLAVQFGFIPTRFLADRVTDASHPFLRRSRA